MQINNKRLTQTKIADEKSEVVQIRSEIHVAPVLLMSRASLEKPGIPVSLNFGFRVFKIRIQSLLSPSLIKNKQTQTTHCFIALSWICEILGCLHMLRLRAGGVFLLFPIKNYTKV